jgi:hypothetical protein
LNFGNMKIGAISCSSILTYLTQGEGIKQSQLW